MGELDRLMDAARVEPDGMELSHRRQVDRSEHWLALTREFVDRMHYHGVGKTALYHVTSQAVMKRRGIFSPQLVPTRETAYNFGLVGRGWFIHETPAIYDDTPTALLVLDENRVVRCTPKAIETPPDVAPKTIELPYVALVGRNLQDATFHGSADGPEAEWLARAAIRLTS